MIGTMRETIAPVLTLSYRKYKIHQETRCKEEKHIKIDIRLCLLSSHPLDNSSEDKPDHEVQSEEKWIVRREPFCYDATPLSPWKSHPEKMKSHEESDDCEDIWNE